MHKNIFFTNPAIRKTKQNSKSLGLLYEKWFYFHSRVHDKKTSKPFH